MGQISLMYPIIEFPSIPKTRLSTVVYNYHTNNKEPFYHGKITGLREDPFFFQFFELDFITVSKE